MFGRGIPMFNLFGFQVRLDPTWFVLAVLITWTLATGFFPFSYPGLQGVTYLLMGLSVAIGLFFSLVTHEFAHAWVARQNGLPMGGITLFLFGGVAEMAQEAPNPKTEFLMALAGPVTSFMLMFLFGGLTLLAQRGEWLPAIVGVTAYLSTLNGILALFNLVPAFPLDGGRILRSALWAWKSNLPWATRITARLGGWFGMLLMVLGVFSLFSGNLLSGFWWILIGLFLRNAANASCRQTLLSRELAGKQARDFMQTDVITVPPELSLKTFMNDFFTHHVHSRYPVVDNGQLAGCLDMADVRAHPEADWEGLTVRDVLQSCWSENVIQADEPAEHALRRLSKNGGRDLLVLEGDRLVGMLSQSALMRYLSIKMDLNEATLSSGQDSKAAKIGNSGRPSTWQT